VIVVVPGEVQQDATEGPDDDPSVPTEEKLFAGLRYWFGPSAVDSTPASDDPPAVIYVSASTRTRRQSPKQKRRAWEDTLSELPDVARCPLGRVRTPGVGFDIIEDFEHRHFGWTNGFREVRVGGYVEMVPVDRIERARAWSRLFSGPRAVQHLANLQLVIDNWIEPIHQAHVVDGRWPRRLPSAITRARIVSGVLTIDETKSRKNYPGIFAFMEHTAPELFYLDGRAVLRRLGRLGLPCFSLGAWDISAGSGTGAATLKPLGWRVVSTDLVNPATVVKHLDARNVGWSPYHRAPFKIDGRQVPPEHVNELEVVIRPHLICLDVSSRGTPTHAEEYGHGFNVEKDFASLDRDQLVEVVVDVVCRGLRLVRRGGCFSLTVREAWRSGAHVVPDHGLTETILEGVRGRVPVEVVDDYQVVYENPVNQAGIGRSRAPIRHVLLGRPA